MTVIRVFPYRAIGLVALAILGMGFINLSALDTPAGSIFGFAAIFLVLPVLAASALERELSIRSIALGAILGVVLTMAIGVAASLYPLESRPVVSRICLLIAIAVLGGTAAWRLRAQSSTAPQPAISWRPPRSGVVGLALGAIALSVAIVGAFATPSQPTAYVAMAVTSPDGGALPAVIEGTAGSASTVLVGIVNATPSAVTSQLVVTGPDWVDSQTIEVRAGDESKVVVSIPLTAGDSTVRVELHPTVGGQDRLIVLRVRGT